MCIAQEEWSTDWRAMTTSGKLGVRPGPDSGVESAGGLPKRVLSTNSRALQACWGVVPVPKSEYAFESEPFPRKELGVASLISTWSAHKC